MPFLNYFNSWNQNQQRRLSESTEATKFNVVAEVLDRQIYLKKKTEKCWVVYVILLLFLNVTS